MYERQTQHCQNTNLSYEIRIFPKFAGAHVGNDDITKLIVLIELNVKYAIVRSFSTHYNY